MSELTISDYLELRRLVDVLYDIQDVRMRTANRLRQMPKDSVKVHVNPLIKVEQDITNEVEGLLAKIPIYTEFLYNVKGVGPRISGSIIAQTMIRFEKISKKEYDKLSQNISDTPRGVASQTETDAQELSASQASVDTPSIRASQDLLDSQVKDVSQIECDNQKGPASYSEEQLKLAQKTANGDYLIPVLRGIQAFDTCSKYWAWWGLHVVEGKAAKRRRGENINWNPKMRTLAWKIGKQFVIQGERYRMYYDREKLRQTAIRMPLGACPQYEACKAKLKNRKKPACKGHIDAMARRKAVKTFISHLYETWRTLEDLPTRPPYVLEYLKHTTKQEPQDL